MFAGFRHWVTHGHFNAIKGPYHLVVCYRRRSKWPTTIDVFWADEMSDTHGEPTLIQTYTVNSDAQFELVLDRYSQGY